MTYQFKIQIADIDNPPIWRRLTVPASFTFYQLHMVIQVAFGWENYHLYQFSEKGWSSKSVIVDRAETELEDDFSDVEKITSDEIKLSEIFKRKGKRYNYLYDSGDEWWHSIVLEEIIKEETTVADCLDGEGACPPEDCGGPWGYARLKQIMKDKHHPEYEEMREWIGLEKGEENDPEWFDLIETKHLVEIAD